MPQIETRYGSLDVEVQEWTFQVSGELKIGDENLPVTAKLMRTSPFGIQTMGIPRTSPESGIDGMAFDKEMRERIKEGIADLVAKQPELGQPPSLPSLDEPAATQTDGSAASTVRLEP